MSDLPPDDDPTWVRDDDDVTRPTRSPRQVGELLDGVVHRRRWGRRLETAAVYGAWNELVGEAIAQRCEPARVEGRTLIVRAESSTWATEVSYLAATILTRAADVIGRDVIEDVRVIVGPLEGTTRRHHDNPVGTDEKDAPKDDAGANSDPQFPRR